MDNRESVVVVTGASSGIGNACATLLAKKGNKVYGTCRNPTSYIRKADEFFELLSMELTDNTSVQKAAEKVFAAEGKVDALICCAGSGLIGAIEDTSLEEAEAIMDINFFGPLRTVKAFLPRMRKARKGRIVVVGGSEGLVASPFQGLYSAAQFALEGMVQSLRLEIAEFGIEAIFFALGSFRTDFGHKRKQSVLDSDSSPYKPRLDSILGMLSRDEAEGADPLSAARAIHSALTAKRVSPMKTAGPIGRRLLTNACWRLPDLMRERILHRYYRI